MLICETYISVSQGCSKGERELGALHDILSLYKYFQKIHSTLKNEDILRYVIYTSIR